MDQQEKIEAFAYLGRKMTQIVANEEEIIRKAHSENPWFVPQFVKAAFEGLTFMLEKEKLERWLSNYEFQNQAVKDIGIIMAGNIPLVGFHDLMAVVLSGNRAVVKLSHRDNVLMEKIIEILKDIDPSLTDMIRVEPMPVGPDAIIATGSDNTARYVDYAYRDIPKLIRRNRTSCCILDGTENRHELKETGKDIFSYFGLGCRNVSKVFVPQGYDMSTLRSAFDDYRWIGHHPKYRNNYRFQSAKFNVEDKEFIDGQFFLLLHSEELVSPISCLYYEEYTDAVRLGKMIGDMASRIQCVVTKSRDFPGHVLPGRTQSPEPWDYADQVDTMQFLIDL